MSTFNVSNIVRLRSFEAEAFLEGVGMSVVRYENGNLIIPVGSPEEALAFIARNAPQGRPESAAAKPQEERVNIPQNVPPMRNGANGVHAPREELVDVATGKDRLRGEDMTAAKVNAPAVSDAPPAPKAKKEKLKKDPAADAKRTVADDVAEQAQAAPAELPKEPARASKEPDPEPEETAGVAETEAGLSEEYIGSAPKLRDILSHMHSAGLRDFEALVSACEERRSKVAILSKIPNMKERVNKTLFVMGYSDAEITGLPPQASDA